MYRQISLLDLKMVTFVTLAFLATTDFSSLAGQDLPPDEPPHDWTPTAINYENVPYPYPVDFLEVRLYGEDHRMAYFLQQHLDPLSMLSGKKASGLLQSIVLVMDVLLNPLFITTCICQLGIQNSCWISWV